MKRHHKKKHLGTRHQTKKHNKKKAQEKPTQEEAPKEKAHQVALPILRRMNAFTEEDESDDDQVGESQEGEPSHPDDCTCD